MNSVAPLPFQVSVVGTPSPSVTPTNLLHNVVASPGAIWLLAAGQTGGSVTWLLRRLRSRALQEPPIERPEYQDNADVYDQPLPEVVPEKQDVHADHDGY
jgi:hypothetical protein